MITRKAPWAGGKAKNLKATATVSSKVRSEHSDQVLLVMHLRTFYPKVLVAAVPNGAATGGLQRVRLVAEGLLPGFPDLCVLEPHGGFHGLFVEMKSLKATAVVSEAQKRVHRVLIARGYRVLVCYGYASAKSQVIKYLELPKTEVCS